MRTIPLFGIALLTLLMASCKQNENSQSKTEETQSLEQGSLSSVAAQTKNDSKRKFIRTADIRFQVQNVAKSTYAVENAVSRFGGFVTNTNLQSEVIDRKQVKISQDSLLQTTRYSVHNDMTIRVPNTQLDTVLKTIAAQVGYLDYRIIKAEDVNLQLLSNDLAQQRLAQHGKRVENAIDNKGRKLDQINDTENDLLAKNQANDAARISNLDLEDRVAFSTVVLQFYQNETLRYEKLANVENAAYRTGFGLQLLDSVKTGWYMLEGIIAFVLQFWSLFLLGGCGYWLYKKFGRRKKLAV